MSYLVDGPQHEYGEEQLSPEDSGGIDAAELERDASNEKSYEEMLPTPIPAKSYEEMRSSPRKKYACNQRIGPMHGGLLPTTDEYFNVECNDISKGGISFYLKRPPGCEQFAVVLGQKPQITILVAKVVNTKEVEHDDQHMYLVGCQFIDRLQK
jgi:PilZ domain